jgi:hypothetical protein
MSKVSIGEDEYEVTDLLSYQQFSLWLNQVVLDVVDDTNDNVVNELNHRIAKCYTNIDWLRAVDTS